MIDHHKTAYWSTEEVNRCKKEMAEVGFKAMTEENESKAKEMVEWVLAQKNDNNYFHNLKVICSQKYIESSNFGIVASIPATYDKTLEIEAEKRRREEELKNSKPSEYVGAIGDRITIDVKSVRVLWTRDTQWGLTFGIEIKDTNDNIYIWSTSSCIDENTKQIKATVKDHSEFRDKKQTVITRGKVVA